MSIVILLTSFFKNRSFLEVLRCRYASFEYEFLEGFKMLFGNIAFVYQIVFYGVMAGQNGLKHILQIVAPYLQYRFDPFCRHAVKTQETNHVLRFFHARSNAYIGIQVILQDVIIRNVEKKLDDRHEINPVRSLPPVQ